MDLYSHVWSLGTTRRRGRGVGVWGGGGDTTRPRQRLGPPTPPRNPRTLKSQGERPFRTSLPLPSHPGTRISAKRSHPPCRTLSCPRPGRVTPNPAHRGLGRSRAAPRPANARPTPSGLADLPQGSRRCRTRAAPPALLSLGPRLSASQGRRSEEPAPGLPGKLTQENVPPGAGEGDHCSVCLCHAAAMQTGRVRSQPPPRRPPPLGPSGLARELRGRARGSPIEPSPA